MDFITMVSNVGFPIAMCGYLLFRFEKIIGSNTAAIIALTDKIKR